MYLRLNEELHQITYERSVGQPFLASLRSNTCDRLFIWHKQAFVQEFASRLGDSSVRWIHQLVHMLAVFVCEDVSVMPSKRTVCKFRANCRSARRKRGIRIFQSCVREDQHNPYITMACTFNIFLSWSLHAGIRQEPHNKHAIWTIHHTVRS